MPNLAASLLDHLSHRDVAERTSALIATMRVGYTFGPGLLPRSTVDQAVLTGLSSALTYGLVTTSQTLFHGVANHFIREADSAIGKYTAEVSANVAMAAIGYAGVRALPLHYDEPAKRAVARSVSGIVRNTGMAGLAVTGAMVATDVAGQRWPRALRLAALPTGMAIGAVIATKQILEYRKEAGDGADVLPPARDPLPLPELVAREEADAEQEMSDRIEWPPPIGKSIAMGAGISAALFTLAGVETVAARGVATATARVIPGLAPISSAIGHAVTLTGLGAGIVTAMEYLYRSQEQGGAAIENAYEAQPQSEFVSGGPKSLIDWELLTREGARFINMALTPEEIETVTGVAAVAPPIRVFGALDIADTVDQRVDKTMAELEALGAFERSVICVASPTGSGYINYVAAETLEYLTRGDCAIVTMQYSLRASFTSLDRVSMGREQNRALMHALTWRLRAIPEDKRPTLIGFGESLGAHTLQDAFLHEGTTGFHRAGLERCLFLGTPAGSGWAHQWRFDRDRLDPGHEVVEVASFEEWEALTDEQRSSSRFVLLSHHEDPIVKFAPVLAVQRPTWLDPDAPRPVGIPRDMRWRVLVTFLTVLVDVKNAMNVKPGTFVARGHDYRADLARMVSVAYNLPMSEDERLRIEEALRRRELHWAQDRLVAEQLNQAREAVTRQMKSWGVSADSPLVQLSAPA